MADEAPNDVHMAADDLLNARSAAKEAQKEGADPKKRLYAKLGENAEAGGHWHSAPLLQSLLTRESIVFALHKMTFLVDWVMRKAVCPGKAPWNHIKAGGCKGTAMFQPGTGGMMARWKNQESNRFFVRSGIPKKRGEETEAKLGEANNIDGASLTCGARSTTKADAFKACAPKPQRWWGVDTKAERFKKRTKRTTENENIFGETLRGIAKDPDAKHVVKGIKAHFLGEAADKVDCDSSAFLGKHSRTALAALDLKAIKSCPSSMGAHLPWNAIMDDHVVKNILKHTVKSQFIGEGKGAAAADLKLVAENDANLAHLKKAYAKASARLAIFQAKYHVTQAELDAPDPPRPKLGDGAEPSDEGKMSPAAFAVLMEALRTKNTAKLEALYQQSHADDEVNQAAKDHLKKNPFKAVKGQLPLDPTELLQVEADVEWGRRRRRRRRRSCGWGCKIKKKARAAANWAKKKAQAAARWAIDKAKRLARAVVAAAKAVAAAARRALNAVKRWAKKFITKLGMALVSRIMPAIVKSVMGLNDKKYKCFCGDYIGQLSSIAPSLDYALLPGWRLDRRNYGGNRCRGPSCASWNKDPGELQFSILRVASNYGSGTKPRNAGTVCQYDVSVRLDYCYKQRQFKNICAVVPKCKNQMFGNTCYCTDQHSYNDYAKRSIMCKPPKNGACKGARVRKRIRFKMIKGTQHKVCRQSYSMVDAGIRGMVGLITATNNELNLRAPCDKMEEEEEAMRKATKLGEAKATLGEGMKLQAKGGNNYKFTVVAPKSLVSDAQGIFCRAWARQGKCFMSVVKRMCGQSFCRKKGATRGNSKRRSRKRRWWKRRAFRTSSRKTASRAARAQRSTVKWAQRHTAALAKRTQSRNNKRVARLRARAKYGAAQRRATQKTHKWKIRERNGKTGSRNSFAARHKETAGKKLAQWRRSGANAAARRAKEKASKVPKQTFRSAIILQEAAARQGMVDAVEAVFNGARVVATKYVCPTREGFRLNGASTKSCVNAKMVTNPPMKGTTWDYVSTNGAYVKNSWSQKSKERLGETLLTAGNFVSSPAKKHQVCSSLSATRDVANHECRVGTASTDEEELGETENETDDDGAYDITMEAVKHASEMMRKDPLTVPHVKRLSQLAAKHMDLGDSTQFFGSAKKAIIRKAKALAFNLAKKMGNGLMVRLMPYILKTRAFHKTGGASVKGNNNPGYKCFCEGMLGQLFDHRLSYTAFPGWRSKTDVFLKKDMGPLVFTLALQQGKSGGRQNTPSFKPTCSWDVSMKWQYCYKDNRFHNKGNTPGCVKYNKNGQQATSGINSFTCQQSAKKAYALKHIACKPDPQGGCKGMPIFKDVTVMARKGGPKRCGASMILVDASIRTLMAFTTAINNELDTLRWCRGDGGD